MLIEPGNVHVTTAVTTHADFDTLFVDASVVAKAAENCGLPGAFPHLSRADSGAQPLLRAFTHLLQTMRDPHGERLERAEAFERALYGLFQHAGEVSPSTQPVGRAKLLRARDLLHDMSSVQNVAAPPSMAELAGSVGLSAIQLIRGFKELYGLPPYQYLVRLRVARALRLIERGPSRELRSLTDVALEAGFCDLAHMDKHLRRMIRMSPSTFAASMNVKRRWMQTSRRAVVGETRSRT